MDVAYLNALYKQLEYPDKAGPVLNFNSTAYMSAVIPLFHYGKKFNSLYDFTGNHQLYNELNINETLRKIINVYKYNTESIINVRDEPIVKDISNDLVKRVVLGWIYNKKQEDPTATYEAVVIDTKSITSTISKDTVRVNLDPVLIKFTVAYVKVYWDRLARLGIPEININNLHVPDVAWGELDPTIRGQYVMNKHVIELNIKQLSKVKGPDNPLSIDSIFTYIRSSGMDLFGETVPSALIPHELSHAWRREQHQSGHNEIKLTIDGQTKVYTYDQGVNAILRLILRDRFVETLLQELTK
jgi:hypothetical protein